MYTLSLSTLLISHNLHSKTFSSIIGFPNEMDLKPYLVRRFASSWYDRIIRDGESYSRGFRAICEAHPELGIHTSILAAYFDHNGDLNIKKAIWCHRFRSPYGIQFQEISCRDCRGLNCLSFKREDQLQKVVVTCLHAPYKGCIARMISIDGVYLVTPKGPKESEGEWAIYPYTWTKFDSQFCSSYDSP